MRLIDLDAFWNYVRSHKINFGKYQHDLLNKQPTVQAVPIEVLDKLRAELHETAEMHEDGDYYLRDEWIDEYFDKYKAESEDKG